MLTIISVRMCAAVQAVRRRVVVVGTPDVVKDIGRALPREGSHRERLA